MCICDRFEVLSDECVGESCKANNSIMKTAVVVNAFYCVCALLQEECLLKPRPILLPLIFVLDPYIVVSKYDTWLGLRGSAQLNSGEVSTWCIGKYDGAPYSLPYSETRAPLRCLCNVE